MKKTIMASSLAVELGVTLPSSNTTYFDQLNAIKKQSTHRFLQMY